MKLLIKKTLLTLALSSIFVGPVLAKTSATDLKEVRNEAGIMLNILQASLKQQNSSNGIRFRTESVFYLANQGVVFEINSGRHGGRFFGFDLDGLNDFVGNTAWTVNAAKAPKSPKPPIVSGSGLNININEDEIERMVMSFVEHGENYDHDLSDKMRELSEEKRELAWEKRELDRSRRDLEFEKRKADNERRKEIEKRLAGLDKEVKKLDEKSKEIEKYRADLETERSEELAKRQAAQQKVYKESLAMFEDTIGDMLCRYGSGLRSLPENENITFILSDFIDADNDSVIGTHDKVYVFENNDVKACVTGKSDKNKLLSSVNTYFF